MKALRGLFAVILASLLAGCGYNTIQQKDEAVKSAWAEVLSQYQRRADLIPNIVSTVKGEADFEKTTLQNVIEARAKATAIQATPELVNNPEAFAKFTQAQGELSSALSRLLVTVENYPEPQGQCRFPGTAHAARRHGKPHRHSAQSLHQIGRGLQHLRATVAAEPHRDGVRLQAEAAVRRGKRIGHQQASDRRLRHAEEVATERHCTGQAPCG